MRVVLFRHGIAVDRLDPSCPSDSERRLTAKGVKRTRAAARGLAALGVSASAVVASPYVRAQQTAAIAVAALRLGHLPVETSESLLPWSEPGLLVRKLGDHGPAGLVCVGHAPHLDRLLGALIGIDGEVSRLKKAGAACVELQDLGSPGRLVWLMEPRVLRTLAGVAAEG